MKKFRLTADVTFYANNGITDAFEELAEHFTKLAEMEDTDLFDSGGIYITPVREDDSSDNCPKCDGRGYFYSGYFYHPETSSKSGPTKFHCVKCDGTGILD